MSENYHLRWPAADPCPTCGHANDRQDLTIGHSGGGWVFLWRGYHSDEDVRTEGRELAAPSQWFTFLADQLAQGAKIVDDYRKEHSLGEFLAFVVNKRLSSNGQLPSRHSELPDSQCQRAEGDDIGFYEFA